MRSKYGYILLVILFFNGLGSLLAQEDDAPIITLQESLRQTEDEADKTNLLIKLSNQLYEIDAKQAANYAEEALSYARNLDNSRLEAKVLAVLGKAYFYQGNKDKANRILKQGIELSKEIKFTEGEVDGLNGLAKINLERQWQDVYQYSVKARDLALEVDYQLGLAESYLYLGSWFLEQSAEEALRQYNLALNIYKKLNLPADIRQTYYLIAQAHTTKTKDFNQALQFYRQALSIGEKLDDKRMLTRDLNAMGQLYLGLQKDVNVAISYFFRAYSITLEYDFISNGVLLGETLEGIKKCYREMAKIAFENNAPQADKYDRLYREYNLKSKMLTRAEFDIQAYQSESSNEEQRRYTTASPISTENSKKLDEIEKSNAELDKQTEISVLEKARLRAEYHLEKDSIRQDIQPNSDNILAEANESEPIEGETSVVPSPESTESSSNRYLLLLSLGCLAAIAMTYAIYIQQSSSRQIKKKDKKINNFQERLNRQEIVLREKEDSINKKEEKLVETYAKFDDARIENSFLTQVIKDEITPPLKEIADEAKQKEGNINYVLQASRKALNSIESVIQVQNVDKKDWELKLTDASICQTADKAISQFDELFRRKSIVVENRIEPFHFARFHQETLEQVFLCLLENSLKYTEPGGKVTLDAWQFEKDTQGYIKVSVKDNGLSIPKNTLPLVFEKFSPEEARPSGLGLVYVKMAIEAQNGQVEAIASVDQGASFIFTLPESRQKPNLDNQHIQEVNKTGYELSDQDLEILEPLLVRFHQLEFYETSALKTILAEVDERINPNIKAWKKDLEDAIYKLDEEKFNQLIQFMND